MSLQPTLDPPLGGVKDDLSVNGEVPDATPMRGKSEFTIISVKKV